MPMRFARHSAHSVSEFVAACAKSQGLPFARMARMRGKKFALSTFLGAPLCALASQAFAQSADEPVVRTAPYLVDADQISSGDTAWMLMATALVLLMTLPGLALFYGGMVRKKNLLSTM